MHLTSVKHKNDLVPSRDKLQTVPQDVEVEKNNTANPSIKEHT